MYIKKQHAHAIYETLLTNNAPVKLLCIHNKLICTLSMHNCVSNVYVVVTVDWCVDSCNCKLIK